MGKTIYTIGHSTQTVEAFISLLKMHSINCVIDVRSMPFSQFASQFNKNELSYELKKEGIQYIHMGEEFGARREDESLYDDDGSLNFGKTIDSSLFKKGMERVFNGLKKGVTIALMCSEKEPSECHRCIMVGKAFDSIEDIDVENILEDGSLMSQDDISKMLVNKYFPQKGQITIFEMASGIEKTDEEYISEAYKLREKEIAYHI